MPTGAFSAQPRVVVGAGHDEQAADAVARRFHLPEDLLQVGQALLSRRRRQMQGARAKILCDILNATVYQVVHIARPLSFFISAKRLQRIFILVIHQTQISRLPFFNMGGVRC